MLLFIILTYILFFIECSSNEQCSLLKYCNCSSDLTIIKCIDHQLTNEFLLKLNNQLSNRTILLNLSSNSLTSIKSLSNLSSLKILDLSFNKIRYLPSNIFSKFPQLITLYIQNNSLITLPKNLRNLPTINFNLSNFFLQNSLQVIKDNQQLILNCSSNFQHYWTLNKQFYSPTIISSSYSTIFIPHLQLNHSGIWTCQNSYINQSISLTILTNSSNLFCQSIQINTSKGYFYWPRTLINKKIETKCPYSSAAWLGDSNQYARAWYTCSSNGQWKNFDISQCGYQTNISRIFDRLSLNDKDLLLNLIKYLTTINRNNIILNDIILLIDLIDEQQEKSPNQDQIMLIYHLTDFILQLKSNFYFNNQYQLAMNRLRLIIERLLDLTNQSWLYIGKELTAMTFQSPSSSTLCFVSNRSLLTINCDTNTQQNESQLLIIEFPSHSNITNQYSLFRMIVYRQSILYASNERKSNENNPVIYIKPISKTNFSTIKLTFSNPSSDISIEIWNINKTLWETKSSNCKINQQNNDFLITDCIMFNNNSLSITYFNNNNNEKSIFLNKKYSQFIIYISSIIAFICFSISILFYICFHKIFQMPRRYFHCLINYWFNLAILFPLFAFGIELNQYEYLCQFISISLQYFCLTTIIWLTLITYSIWRKLYVILSDDKKSSSRFIDSNLSIKLKSIIQFYLLAYGIAFIICMINIIISYRQNIINKICFINNFNSILILIISILIFIFILLILLLITRNYIKKYSHKFHLINNEILPILNSSNENSEQIFLNINSNYLYSLNIDKQYESINQLLSILSQLILLIFLFLSTLTIYLRPLHLFKLRFEHIIYSHLYGFFLIFLAFYILSYYVLSHFRLIIHYYSNHHQSLSINNKESDISLSIEQLSILPQTSSHNSSKLHGYDESQNTSITDYHTNSMKRLTNITSKYYICHEQILKTNSSQNLTLPVSSLDTISQETIGIYQSPRNSSYERSINIPIEYYTIQTKKVPLYSSQSFTHPPISLSQAIIRPLPTIRLSLQNQSKNLSNSIDIIQTNEKNSYRVASSSSTEEYNIINKIDHVSQEKSAYDYTQVSYIDEDDERSVSLKSPNSDSKTSPSIKLTKKTRLQTLLTSSSSSSNSSNDLYTKPLKIHESSV